MPRLRRAAFPLIAVAALGLLGLVLVETSAADLDNLVYTSRTHHLRLVVPRGWRASDLPTYPGMLLWMARSDPQGQMELTAEPLTHDLVCSWPPACRNTSDLLSTKYACALRIKLEAQKLKVGPIQPGPRETEDAGLPSVWFEYDDGKHFLRQAIAFSTDRAISLVLVAPTGEARATHTRAFEQALRTLHPLSAEEAARAEGNLDAGAPPPGDRAVTDGGSRVDGGPPVDGGLAAASPIADAGPNDAGVNGLFEPAPTPRFDPTTPCK